MDLLITFLALLVAVYAVVPRERQLDISLRIELFDKVVIGLGVLVIFYLEFYDFFLARGWVFNRPWPEGVTPRNTQYLVTVVVIAVITLRIKFTHLTAGRIQKFQALAEELYWTERYGELFSLLQKHLREFFRVYHSKFLLARIRLYFEKSIVRGYDPELINKLIESLPLGAGTKKSKKVTRPFPKPASLLIRKVAPSILHIIPDYSESRQVAGDIVRAIFLSPRFATGLAKTRPYLGLEIIRESTHCQERFKFVDVYLRALIKDTESVLYGELQNNQNCSEYRYQISASNRLIHFFLADAKVAYDNYVWKPFGEYAIAYLDGLIGDHESDPYNRAMGDFEQEGAWQSSLFATIRFFDIMVKEALFQNIEWHMWLYYMPMIVKRMVRNYRVADPLSDPSSEWPTQYSFLLYQAFSAMRDWITALQHIPRGQANATLKSTSTEHENNNIPKSSAIALCQCLVSVLESAHIGDRQKRMLANMVFELFFELRSSPGLEGYATVLRTLLARGGQFTHRSEVFRSALIVAFKEEEMEFYTKRNEEEYISELEAAVYGRSV